METETGRGPLASPQKSEKPVGELTDAEPDRVILERLTEMRYPSLVSG
jgi:hypothetical protein